MPILNLMHFFTCRSYFAFNLASEHHKFYLKLRDSFLTLNHILNELNIPLTLNHNEVKESEIFPSDYERDTEKPSKLENAIVDGNIKNIDKATKTTGLRVRNLKKSMLNDNKLIKLRNKFLKRSKSTLSAASKYQEPEKSDELYDHDEYCTKEECQNKENELPKTNHVQQVNQQKYGQPEAMPKVMSPNRNRVKMGTRVFSTRFLNKSFENLDLCRLNDYGNCSSDHSEDRSVHNESGSNRNQRMNSRDSCKDACETDVDNLSLKSTSLNSLYFSEKLSESPSSSRAYVIREL